MDTAYLILIALAGFFAGATCWALITRWVALLYETSKKHGGDFLGIPKRRLAWSFPFIAILHPAMWVLVGVAFVTVQALRTPSPSLTWLLAGFYAAFTLMAISTLATLAMIRRRRKAGPKRE